MSCRKVLNLSAPLPAEVPVQAPVRPTVPLQQQQPPQRQTQPREHSELDIASIRTIIQLLEASNQSSTTRPSAPPVETQTPYRSLPSVPLSLAPGSLQPMDPKTKKIVHTILGVGIFTIFFVMMYYFVWKT